MSVIDQSRRLPLLDPAQLLRTTALFARHPDPLRHLDTASTQRSWHRLESTDRLEVWLIGWPPGTGTGWHDHAGSSGAFRVIHGTLTESVWSRRGPQSAALTGGVGRSFGHRHIHDVRNDHDEFAVSIHAYAPALDGMNSYQVEGTRLVPQHIERSEKW